MLVLADFVAATLRRLGLRRLVPIGRRVLNAILHDRLMVKVSGLTLYGDFEHRGYLDLLANGQAEPLTAQMFVSELRHGMTVLDCGSFLGYYALLAAQRVGPEGRVYAFEPDSRSLKRLVQNVRANRFDSIIRVIGKGVSDAAHRRRFYQSTVEPSQSSALPLDSPCKDVEIEFTTVDSVLSARERVDVIKMDVEGWELRALRGMKNTLRHKHRMVMFVECNAGLQRKAGSTAENLVVELKGLGFRVAVINDDTRELVALNLQLVHAGHSNLYCVRE